MSPEKNSVEFDIAVIGGGPAGIGAAGRAGELGGKVILLEKNNQLGAKLLLTGKGRCNLTNAEFDLRNLVSNYGEKGKFLFHAFHTFGPKAVIDFFETLGVPTKIERGKRVFPVSDRAEDVCTALASFLNNSKVKVMRNAQVMGIECKNRKIKKLILKNGEIRASNYILATGGKSYPKTGSTGDGYTWAKALGHTVTPLSPALVPITTKEVWVKRLQGLSLKNVEASVWQKGKKEASEFGECLFTHFGLSGPIIHTLSHKIGTLLKKGAVEIHLDLKPALDFSTLDKRIQRDFQKGPNKAFKNSLGELLPHKLISVVVELSKIDPEKRVNLIRSEERQSLGKLLKSLSLTASWLLGFDEAIVTSGGISLSEIDDKTMRSKIIDNLFFAGEIIDVDGPTGGFNLQICWSTGYLAGESAVES